MAIAINLAKCLSELLEPFIPQFSEKLNLQLNCKKGNIKDKFTLDIPAGHQLGKIEILFKPIDAEHILKLKEKFGGGKKIEDIFPADIRGGVILSVEDHPNDNNLYILKVNVGKEQRQVLGRLKEKYSKEELMGKQVLVLCNLPPAELKGFKSEAMVLVAEGKNNEKQTIQKLLEPGEVNNNNWPGTQIVPEGASLDAKLHLTLKEFQKLDLKVTKDQTVVFKQKYTLKSSNSPIKSAIPAPAKIK